MHMSLDQLADTTAALQAVISARRTLHLRQASGAMPFRHDDWRALVTRFASDDGVDYAGLLRVRRLVGEYLRRLSHARPEQLVGQDDWLAFYLNAFNAIAVHQVIEHYPVASLRAIPHAFARPFPIGHALLSLNTLLHTRIRTFGDPRVHAAVVPANASAPPLRAYSGEGLQAELDRQLRGFLADPVRGIQTCAEDRLKVSGIVRRFAGDFAAPEHMPSVLALALGRAEPRRAMTFLEPYLLAPINASLPHMTVGWLPDVPELNMSSR